MFDTYVHNLTTAFNAATGDQLQRGLRWYPRATDLAHAVATATGTTSDAVAGVIAALSPRCSWTMQERFTERFVTEYLATGDAVAATHPGIYQNKRKAGRILDGSNPLDVLGGEKVRAFYLNISQRNNNVPTLDVWSVRAAVADPLLGSYECDRLTRGKLRIDLVAAYHTAAKIVGVRVDNFQAITWVVCRETALGVANGNN